MFIFTEWSNISGNEEIAEFLIKNGANVNHENYAGETPLHISAIAGNYKLANVHGHWKVRRFVFELN